MLHSDLTSGDPKNRPEDTVRWLSVAQYKVFGPPVWNSLASYGASAVTRTRGRGHVAEVKTNFHRVFGFPDILPAVRLKHPFPINNRHGRSRSFCLGGCRRRSRSFCLGGCRRQLKAVFALSKAELRQTDASRRPSYFFISLVLVLHPSKMMICGFYSKRQMASS